MWPLPSSIIFLLLAGTHGFLSASQMFAADSSSIVVIGCKVDTYGTDQVLMSRWQPLIEGIANEEESYRAFLHGVPARLGGSGIGQPCVILQHSSLVLGPCSEGSEFYYHRETRTLRTAVSGCPFCLAAPAHPPLSSPPPYLQSSLTPCPPPSTVAVQPFPSAETACHVASDLPDRIGSSYTLVGDAIFTLVDAAPYVTPSECAGLCGFRDAGNHSGMLMALQHTRRGSTFRRACWCGPHSAGVSASGGTPCGEPCIHKFAAPAGGGAVSPNIDPLVIQRRRGAEAFVEGSSLKCSVADVDDSFSVFQAVASDAVDETCEWVSRKAEHWELGRPDLVVAPEIGGLITGRGRSADTQGGGVGGSVRDGVRRRDALQAQAGTSTSTATAASTPTPTPGVSATSADEGSGTPTTTQLPTVGNVYVVDSFWQDPLQVVLQEEASYGRMRFVVRGDPKTKAAAAAAPPAAEGEEKDLKNPTGIASVPARAPVPVVTQTPTEAGRRRQAAVQLSMQESARRRAGVYSFRQGGTGESGGEGGGVMVVVGDEAATADERVEVSAEDKCVAFIDPIVWLDPVHFFAGLICVVCCAGCLMSYYLFPLPAAVSSPPASVLIWRIKADLLFGFTFVIGLFGPQHGTGSASCTAQALFLQFSMSAALMWWTITSFSMLRLVRHPFQTFQVIEQRGFKRWALSQYKMLPYHAIAWTYASVTTLVLWGTGYDGVSQLGFCWVRWQVADVNLMSWGLLYIPITAFLGFSILVLLYSVPHLASTGMPRAQRMRKATLELTSWYIVVFAVTWLVLGLVWVARHAKVTVGRYYDRTEFYLFGLGISVVGLADALCWWVTISKTTSALRTSAPFSGYGRRRRLRLWSQGLDAEEHAVRSSEPVGFVLRQDVVKCVEVAVAESTESADAELSKLSSGLPKVVRDTPELAQHATWTTPPDISGVKLPASAFEETVLLSLQRPREDDTEVEEAPGFVKKLVMGCCCMDEGGVRGGFSCRVYAPTVFSYIRSASGVVPGELQAILKTAALRGTPPEQVVSATQETFAYTLGPFAIRILTESQLKALTDPAWLKSYVERVTTPPESLLRRIFAAVEVQPYKRARWIPAIVEEAIVAPSPTVSVLLGRLASIQRSRGIAPGHHTRARARSSRGRDSGADGRALPRALTAAVQALRTPASLPSRRYGGVDLEKLSDSDDAFVPDGDSDEDLKKSKGSDNGASVSRKASRRVSQRFAEGNPHRWLPHAPNVVGVPVPGLEQPMLPDGRALGLLCEPLVVATEYELKGRSVVRSSPVEGRLHDGDMFQHGTKFAVSPKAKEQILTALAADAELLKNFKRTNYHLAVYVHGAPLEVLFSMHKAQECVEAALAVANGSGAPRRVVKTGDGGDESTAAGASNVPVQALFRDLPPLSAIRSIYGGVLRTPCDDDALDYNNSSVFFMKIDLYDQQYTAWKQLKEYVRTKFLKTSPDSISSLDPGAYSVRFVRKLKDYFIAPRAMTQLGEREGGDDGW